MGGLKQDGVILVGALITMAFFAVTSIAVAEFGINHYQSARRSLQALNALSVAEAGVEEVMYELNQDSSYAGSGGPITLYNDTRGKAIYETSVENSLLNNEKIVYSTGRLYVPANSATPKSTRKIKLVIRGVAPFNYALQTGNGPIYMFGNTTFASAKLHSNNFIKLQDAGVTVSGEFSAAGKDPATGADNCSFVGNNTNIQSGSTIKARYNVLPAGCRIGTSGSTVTENDLTVVTQPLPSVDREGILGGISINGACDTIDDSPYEIKNAHYPNNSPSNGIDSTPACRDFKLKKNTNYKLIGNAHIRGNLTIDGNVIEVDSAATSDVYVLVEGTITVKGNGASIVTNANNVGVIFISYETIDSNGEKTAPNTIEIKDNSLSLRAKFLAPDGSIGFQGRGSVGPLAGKSIILNGTGTMTFLDVEDVPANPNTWDVKYYQQIFD